MVEKTKNEPVQRKPIVYTGQPWGLFMGTYNGKASPWLRTCYLCKRNEYDGSRIVRPDGEVSAGFFEVLPYEIPIDDVGEESFVYWLCGECSYLLRGSSKMERIQIKEDKG